METKLEMVHAALLFHCGAAIPCVRWINSSDRLQRDEIDRRLQGGIGPREGAIYVSANKSLGRWNYSGLVVEVGQTHERIDLRQRSAPSNSS